MNIPYAIALALSGLISAMVAIFSWRRRSIPGAVSLSIAMLGMAIWSATYSIRWMVNDPALQFFWLNATYIGVCTAPTAYFIFSFQVVDQAKFFTRGRLKFFLIEPLLTLIILWTDRFHGLFYAGNQTTGAILNGGVWFWFNAIYSYLLLFIAAFVLVKCALLESNLYRYQSITLFLGLLLPWIGTTIGILGISPFPNLDITPFTFIITGLIFAQALFRRRLLDIDIIARNTLVENMNDGVIVVDRKNRLVDINPAACSIFQIDKSDIGKHLKQVFAEETSFLEIIESGQENPTELQLFKDNNLFYEVRISSLYDSKKLFTGKLFLLRDITEKKIADQKVIASESKYRMLFENSLEMILVLQNGYVQFCNQRTCEITGYSIDEIISRPILDFIHPEDRKRVYENYQKRLDNNPPSQNYEFRIVRKDQTIRWIILNSVNLNWDGNPSTLNFLSDITEQKQTELELLFQNTHDFLTGLYNRQYFQTELDRLSNSRQYPISLIMIDMDGLKQVNDTLGHKAGDDVLQHAAAVLKESFRPEDMVSRLGGDEFVIVLPQTDRATVQSVIERLKHNILEHNRNCLSYQTVRLSIGYATVEQQEDLNHLLAEADKCMYADKQKNKILSQQNNPLLLNQR